ncbi:MAG: hypothetical protein J6P02_01875 [Lachnospiraceae bacterium]|nr:hypothetical protein [Lachnospiraceae bacterium]
MNNMGDVVVRLISIFITFMIFLGALMLMKEYNVSMPIKILVLIALIIIVDFIKSLIFGKK